MGLIDADLAVAKCNEDIIAVKDISQRVDGILDAIMNIHECPTIDAVPRQKYEEDMESAFAHGYTDAESDFRKMIADGELVEVVRCENCKHFHYDMPYVIQGIPVLGHEVCDFWGDGCKTSENGFCSYAERRADE